MMFIEQIKAPRMDVHLCNDKAALGGWSGLEIQRCSICGKSRYDDYPPLMDIRAVERALLEEDGLLNEENDYLIEYIRLENESSAIKKENRPSLWQKIKEMFK